METKAKTRHRRKLYPIPQNGYGTETRIIRVFLNEKTKIDLELKTTNDNVFIYDVIRYSLEKYLNNDEVFMNEFYKYLKEKKFINKSHFKNLEEQKKEKEQIQRDFNLDAKELEDLFDIIESENKLI